MPRVAMLLALLVCCRREPVEATRADDPAPKPRKCDLDPRSDAAHRLGETTLTKPARVVDKLTVISAEATCGTGGCAMELYASVDGCTRWVGATHGGAIDSLRAGAHGLPDLIVEGAGKNTTDFRLELVGGHYEVVATHECVDSSTCNPWKVARPKSTVVFDYGAFGPQAECHELVGMEWYSWETPGSFEPDDTMHVAIVVYRGIAKAAAEALHRSKRGRPRDPSAIEYRFVMYEDALKYLDRELRDTHDLPSLHRTLKKTRDDIVSSM